MKFADEAIIQAQSGNGGPGSASFRREKFVPRGGPDGGDGGDGGSVIAEADINTQTLLDFRFKPIWKAPNGQPGEGRRKTGSNGEDIIIKLPIGTEIFDAETGELVCDLTEDKQQFTLLSGGMGGKGNEFFKSSTNQTPLHAQKGTPGAEQKFKLNLKLLADVGIVGFPNAGKSTLISKISSAKPKIADYPFTTLEPNLGLVKGKGHSFVVADVPGIIAGASEGKGLGSRFLKHLERTKVLLFLIDPYAPDEKGEPLAPLDNYQILKKELLGFTEMFSSKQETIAISKSETISQDQQSEIIIQFKSINKEVMFISSFAEKNLADIVWQLEDKIFQKPDLIDSPSL